MDSYLFIGIFIVMQKCYFSITSQMINQSVYVGITIGIEDNRDTCGEVSIEKALSGQRPER